MQKLDKLDREDNEYHKFLSGARSNSQYSKREEIQNSTAGLSRKSGGKNEYSAR